jgi:hypothetical protein
MRRWRLGAVRGQHSRECRTTAARYLAASSRPVRDATYSGMSWNALHSQPAGSPTVAANASKSALSSRRNTPP